MSFEKLEKLAPDFSDAGAALDVARQTVSDCAGNAWVDITSNDGVANSMSSIKDAADAAWETCSPAIDTAGEAISNGARNGAYLGGRFALGVADVGENAYIGVRSNIELAIGDEEAAVQTAQIHTIDSAADSWGDRMGADKQMREIGDISEACGEIATEIALGAAALTASASAAAVAGGALVLDEMGKSLESSSADGDISQEEVFEEVALGTVTAGTLVAGRGLNHLNKAGSTEKTTETKEPIAPSRYIDCPNSSLAGDVHPMTGVPFERKTITLSSGERVKGVFPKFDSYFDARISNNLFTSSNRIQFKECNSQLLNAIEKDPVLASKFSTQQIEQIREGTLDGSTPDGFVWHHKEEEGLIQLVDRAVHEATGHAAGKAIWGGGY